MRNLNQKRKYLAIYQILNGVFGILFLFLLNIVISSSTIIILLGLNLFSIYCGYLLLKKNYSKGLDFSIYNQMIQVISFGIYGFAFQFFSGIYAHFGLDITNDTILNYGAGYNTWTLKFNTNSNIFININIIAIILILFISKLKKLHENHSENIIK